MPLRRTAALIVALLLTAVACGDGDDDEARPTTTSTRAPTTTAVPAPEPPGLPAGASPLTGLVAEGGRAGRPGLIVKIDNAPRARPQAGLNQADVVYEEAVEGGVTRFAAVYHSQEADPVGPVRSARTTDMILARPMNRPLFAYSGANADFQQIVRASPVVNVGVDAFPGDYFRDRRRPAPYNLMGSTPKMFAHTPPGAGPVAQLFTFRPAGQGPVGGKPSAGVQVEFRGRIVTRVQWQWDPAASVWKRSQDGGSHVDAAGAQVVAHNVIVQFTNYRDTGYRDRSGAVVPEAELIADGDLWLFTAGHIIGGRWRKTSPDAPIEYLDRSGASLPVTPGRTWVELPTPGSATAL